MKVNISHITCPKGRICYTGLLHNLYFLLLSNCFETVIVFIISDVHIATFIRSVLNETYQSLISECSSLEVMLSTEGKHKEKFPETYQKFVQSIGRLEVTLCAYVKSTITEKISIENGLAVIQRYVNKQLHMLTC